MRFRSPKYMGGLSLVVREGFNRVRHAKHPYKHRILNRCAVLFGTVLVRLHIKSSTSFVRVA